MKTHAENHQAGFTLIEYIVTLVIAAIVASMVYTFFGNTLTQSSVPIARLQQTSNLHQVMENIVADYNRLNDINLRYKWLASMSYARDSVVVPTTTNGHYYKCTTAGTSGATEPTTWPTTTGGTVTNGTATFREGGIIWTGVSGAPNETIVWRRAQAYSANDIMIPIKNNGHYYRCTTAGTSSGSDPVVWTPSTSYSVSAIVTSSLFNGRSYQCTTAGISGSTEPTWPTTNGGTVTDNTVTWMEVPDGTVRWTEAGTILARSDNTPLLSGYEAVLIDNIYNYLTTAQTRYGTGYTVMMAETKFIKFSGTNEADATGSDEKNILKVTIKSNDSSETLTQLFTIR